MAINCDWTIFEMSRARLSITITKLDCLYVDLFCSAMQVSPDRQWFSSHDHITASMSRAHLSITITKLRLALLITMPTCFVVQCQVSPDRQWFSACLHNGLYRMVRSQKVKIKFRSWGSKNISSLSQFLCAVFVSGFSVPAARKKKKIKKKRKKY